MEGLLMEWEKRSLDHAEIRESLRREIRSTRAFQLLRTLQWWARDWASPAPFHIKQSVLERYGSGIDVWIESGTYRGDMTDVLSRLARRTITIEPMPTLWASAVRRFQKRDNIAVVNSASENILEKIVSNCSGVVGFWLDGHWDGNEITFQGNDDVPILAELQAISATRHSLAGVRIFIDDVRLFTHANHKVRYPSLRELTQWAEGEGLIWWIEHDIFCALSPDSFTSASVRS